MFSLRLAGAPALGSSVGSGVALGAAVAAGFSVAGGRVLRPVVGRSGGFSQSMYQAATAQASASTQQTMTVAILAARPMRRRAVFCFFGAVFSRDGFFAACAPESLPFIFIGSLSLCNVIAPMRATIV